MLDVINPIHGWSIIFFTVSDIFKDLGLHGKPEQVYNCNKTIFCHDPSKTRVVGGINEKSERKASASGREEKRLKHYCVFASDRMLTLLCVIKGNSSWRFGRIMKL